MIRRNLCASLLLALLAVVGMASFGETAHAAPAGLSLMTTGERGGNITVPAGYRGHGPRVQLHIGPSYRGFEYPYYYDRGYYSRHIGPGYVYHYPIYERPAYDFAPRHGSRRCAVWHRRCAANWGYGGDDYHGCLAYHRCE